MQAHKEVGLHPPGFLHAHMQGDKKIAIARQVGAHRVAIDAGSVDTVAQQKSQLQHHVFFLRAAGPEGTRIFAAMAGV